MKYSRVISVTLVAAGVFGAGGAKAGVINVVNASFETPPALGYNIPCGGNCAFADQPIVGWVSSDYYDTKLQAYSGQNKIGTSTKWFNSVPDGFIYARANKGSISQVVSAVAIPGATYTLNVDVGFRKDAWDSGQVFLVIDGHQVHATPTAPVVQFSGNWVDYTASYTATAADAGRSIEVLLEETYAGHIGNWDNVRLTDNIPLLVTDPPPVVGAPEPTTWAMMLVGFFGVASLALRRRARDSRAAAV